MLPIPIYYRCRESPGKITRNTVGMVFCKKEGLVRRMGEARLCAASLDVGA